MLLKFTQKIQMKTSDKTGHRILIHQPKAVLHWPTSTQPGMRSGLAQEKLVSGVCV